LQERLFILWRRLRKEPSEHFTPSFPSCTWERHFPPKLCLGTTRIGFKSPFKKGGFRGISRCYINPLCPLFQRRGLFPFKSLQSEPKIGLEMTYNNARLKSLSFFIALLDALQSRVYAVSMPCRDRSDSRLSNLRKMGRFQPSPPCRVPAQGCWVILKSLILMAKFCKSRIVNPGTGSAQPWYCVDRNTQACGFRPGILRGYLGTRAGFSLPSGPRPAIFSDF
jgi:hypothetical protein